jgi:hypothetical protein
MHLMKRGVVLALVMLAAACSDDDETIAPGENTRVEISSDPANADIYVDDTNSGKKTPSTFFDLVGEHDIIVRLDRDNIGYGYRTTIDVRGDSLHRFTGPLVYRCPRADQICKLNSARPRDLGRMRIATQANGSLFMRTGSGDGLLWPLGTSNSYVASGMPLIAMIPAGTADTLAIGMYDTDYLAGRPEPTVSQNGQSVKQATWIVPPTNIILSNMPTVRGIEVEEELTTSSDSNVVFLKLTFRNITNRDSYRAIDPVVPNSGMTFNQVYVGFALDPDIGRSDDDMVTYEGALDLVYAYDNNFSEEIFTPVEAGRPGMVGLKLVSVPAGSTAKSLNAWPISINGLSSDWAAGTNTERGGFSMLSGLRSLAPDHPGQLIGYVPSSPNDYRMSVGAGPVTLAPGGETSITVAIILATPVAGEFTTGQVIPAGNPTDDTRQIRRAAATLFDRARNAVLP